MEQLRAGIGDEGKVGDEADLPNYGEEPEGDEQFLSYYQEHLRKAKASKAEQINEEKWDEYARAMNNKYDLGGVTVNKVYSNGKVITTTAAFRRPKVLLVPFNDPRLWFHAKIRERLDNYLLDAMEVGRLTKKVATDLFLCGRFFVKAGFSTEWDQGKKVGKKRAKLEMNSLINEGMPWAKRVNPRDVWVIGGGDMEDVRFLFHQIYRPYEDLKADDRLDQDVIDELSPEKEDERWDDVKLVEVWDRKRETWGIFKEDCKEGFVKKMVEWDWWPWISDTWNWDGEHFWASSDVDQFFPQQKETNRTREQLRRHSQIALLKIFVKKDALDPDAEAKFLSNSVGVLVKTKIPPAEAVKAMTVPIPPELFTMLDRCDRDIREILGHNLNVMGEYVGKSRVTAAETAEVGEGTDLRLSERRDVIAKMVEKLTKLLHTITVNGWKDSEAGSQQMVVMGPKAAQKYLVSWSMKDLEGMDEDFEVNVEDDPYDTKDKEKGELGEMIQLIMQGGGSIPSPLSKIVEEYFGGVKSVPSSPGQGGSPPNTSQAPQGPQGPQGGGVSGAGI